MLIALDDVGNDTLELMCMGRMSAGVGTPWGISVPASKFTQCYSPTYIPACHAPSPCCLLSSPCTNLSGMPSCTLTWMPHISVNTPSSSSPSMGGCVASRTSATISNASVLQLHLLASELFFFPLSFHWHISGGGAIHATHWQDLIPVLGQCGCVTYAPEILFFLFTYDRCTASHVTSPVLFLLL